MTLYLAAGDGELNSWWILLEVSCWFCSYWILAFLSRRRTRGISGQILLGVLIQYRDVDTLAISSA